MTALKECRNEVRKILESKFTNAKEYEKNIFNLVKNTNDIVTQDNYKESAYEKVGQLMCVKNEKEENDIIEDIKNNKIGFESCIYKNYKEKHESMIDKSQERPKAVKGIYKCKQKGCGSDEFYIWSEQKRSADEGMSQMRMCKLCGKRGIN